MLSARPTNRAWPWPVVLLALLALVVLAGLLWQYAAGNEATLPLLPQAQLAPVPLTLDQVAVGTARLPVQVNGYVLTETLVVGGPVVRPAAALALVVVLGCCLTYALALLSTLARLPFAVGASALIFLLMSLNADALGIFAPTEQYFLLLCLVLLVGSAYVFHAWLPQAPLGARLAWLGLLTLGLGLWLLQTGSAQLAALHLAAYAAQSGMVALVLLVLWTGIENIRLLLWLNTQAEQAASRFGLWAFVLASSLYLGLLLLYVLSGSDTEVLPGVPLDPYLLLLGATIVSGVGLAHRQTSVGSWVSAGAAPYLFGTLVLYAGATLAYAFATQNMPLLEAGRAFTALAFLILGVAFLLYVLVNFAPLIRQRLRVYRVVFEPRRLPFYTVYLLGVAALAIVLLRQEFTLYYQSQAAYYNYLGDLTRWQSEQDPADEALALLAERYYAESDWMDRYNHTASLGRAALYRARAQRQNELNALRRALSRAPSEKISLWLASLFHDPADFFQRQRALWAGLRAFPGSAHLASELALLYTRSTLTDSVNYYQQRALQAAPASSRLQSNQLAFLLQQGHWAAAHKQAAGALASTPAYFSNQLLTALLAPTTHQATPTATTDTTLSVAAFAQLYHAALLRAQRHDTTLLPTLRRLPTYAGNDGYVEQLQLLQAITQQYGGRPASAQQTLIPLASAQTTSAAYYQQLQGLWLLEQGAATSSAMRFAESLGSPPVPLAAAYAFALAGQPDSARQVAARAAAVPAQAGAARHLLAVLQHTAGSALLAPDSVKVDFLVLRGTTLSGAARAAVAGAVRQPGLRELAARAQAMAALAQQQPAEALELAQTLAPSPATRSVTASAWNVVRGRALAQQQNLPALRRLLAAAYFQAADNGYAWYFRGLTAASPAQAAQWYQRLAREAPYVEEGLLAAGRYFQQQRQPLAAYQVLLRGIEYNPESVPLLKAYTLAAVAAGLPDYAAVPLQKLRTLLSPAEYVIFQSQPGVARALAPTTPAWN